MGKYGCYKYSRVIDELKKMKNDQKSLLIQKWLNALIKMKKQETLTQLELDQYLGIRKWSLENWLTIYKIIGILGVIIVLLRLKDFKLIDSEVQGALLERMNGMGNKLRGYYGLYLGFSPSKKYKWRLIKTHFIPQLSNTNSCEIKHLQRVLIKC